MVLRASSWLRFLVPLVLVLLSASAAQAQRVPEFVIWSAGASLFAPFVAVPVKLGMLRLLSLETGISRLWSISAIEWILWFPVAVILIRTSRSSSLFLIVLALFASAAWLHRQGVANARWRSAILLSLLTPVLALLLPLLVLASIFLLESLDA